MTYKQYWVGKRVIYSGDGNVYTVVGVDANGCLLIDKPSRFTVTTAVEVYQVQEI